MKKTIAIVIAALMLLSLIPVNAFAVDYKCPADLGQEHTTDNCDCEFYKAVPAKCNSYGYNLYLCLGCEEYFADDFYFNDSAHNYELTSEKVEATCTTDGKEAVYTCSNCGDVIGGETIKGGHDYQPKGEPTGDCLNGGEQLYECTVCGDTYVDVIPGTGEGHKYNERPDSYTAPTCGTPGYAYFECINGNCGHVKVVEIEVLEHDWVAATCTAPKTCSVCGATDGDPLGHDMVVTKNEGATCTTPGAYEAECSRCDYSVSEEMDLLPHEYVEVQRKEPTCGAEGFVIYECKNCPANYQDILPKVDHEYELDKDHSLAPTCTLYGYDVYFCTACGAHKFDQKDPLGHNMVETGRTEPTCTAPGSYTLTCSRDCGETDVIEIPATGHSLQTDVVEATCHTYKVTTTYCTECDYEVVVTGTEFDPDNHDIQVVHTNLPTCLEPGSDFNYCANCENVWWIDEIPALGHDFDASITANVTVLSPATCTEKSLLEVKCSRCDQTTVMEGEALGHNFTKFVQGVDSTCYAEGYTTHYECTECGAKNALYSVIEKKPHDLQDTVVDPLCPIVDTNGQVVQARPGYTLHKCQNSGCTFESKDNFVDYVYDPDIPYASIEDAQAVHPGLSLTPTPGYEFIKGDCYKPSVSAHHCADCGKEIHIVIGDGTGVHLWDVLVKSEQAPTCTENGYTAIVQCSRCGEFKGGEVIPAPGHDWEAATCTTPKTCKVCSATEGEALGHTWVDATCTAPKTCSVCGETEGTALGHTWVDPTCTEDGYCSVCGEAGLPATGHTPKFSYNVDANCTEIGFIYWVCANCGDEDAHLITNFEAPLGHSYVDVVEQDSTCITPGHTAGSQCSVCGDWETATTVIPVKDYHWNGAEELYDICTNVVEGSRYCVWCQATIGMTHPADKVTSFTVDPDCNSDGYTIELCTACNTETVTGYAPMREEHLWSAWQVGKVATITEPGWNYRYCECCIDGDNLAKVEKEYTSQKAAEDDAKGMTSFNYQKVITTVPGVLMYLDADNADAPGAGFTDGSLVALTITMDSIETQVWGTTFRVNHSANLEYVDCDYHAESIFENYNVYENEANNFVSITATVPNVSDTEVGETTIGGEMKFITLYFRVVNGEIAGTSTTADFNVTNIEMIDKNNNAKTVVAEDETITINKLMDVNADGYIGLSDILIGTKMTTGEYGTDYDVAIDIDRNGIIEEYDLEMIMLFMNGALTYDQVVAG